jgi:hypothetical protein
MTAFITNLKRRPPEDEVLAELEPEPVTPSGSVMGQPMTLSGLYYIFKPNPWGYRVGTWFRRFADGYEKAITEQRDDGRLGIIGYEGLILPHSAVGPYLRKVLKHGFDGGAFRQDRRKALGD